MYRLCPKARFLFLSFVIASAVFLFWASSSRAASGRFLVAIDIGHHLQDQGAESARGVGEYFFNRTVAEAVMVELAKNRRIQAVLVNPSGAEITLKDRAEAINRLNPRLLLSIHHDSVQPHYLSNWTFDGSPRSYCDLFQGFSIFVSAQNPHPGTSTRFALNLGEALLRQGFHPTNHHMEPIEGENRTPIDVEKGVFYYDNLVVLRRTRVPAVLLECGVIKNRVEELVLASPSTRKNLARAIRTAVEETMRGLAGRPSKPSRKSRPGA